MPIATADAPLVLVPPVAHAPAWDALVAEGRELAANVHAHQWRLGDLALEVAPVGQHGGAPTGAEQRLNRFAHEIGLSYRVVDACRHVAAKWTAEYRRLDSVGGRPAASWSVHQALAAVKEKEQLINARQCWTVREAREVARALRSKQEDDDFKSFDLDSLEPPDGCCRFCGTEKQLWSPMRRRNAA